MRHSSRWMFRGWPLLAFGAVLLMLLPGEPASTNGVTVVAAPRPAHPSILAAAAAQTKVAAPPHVTTAALEIILPSAKTPALRPAPALGLPAISSDWSTYLGHPAAVASVPALPAGLSDGRVGQQAVNVRSGPSMNAAVQFVLPAGEAVKLGESSAGWRHVYRASGEDGWVFGRYVDGTSGAGGVAPALTASR